MEVTHEERLLLSDVINLRKRYKLVDTLNAKPFNIFSILRSERNERFTHSAFIAELLNPKGTHCQGSLFLKLFLNEFEWPEFTERYLEKTIVKVEHHVGNGFIDIWIDFGNAYICIENKIDAIDQKDQLVRYDSYCASRNRIYRIIYLTLDGHAATDTTNSENKEIEYLQWSYEVKIISWLDECIKYSARIPVLRETIYQYQQLVKKLCGQLQNENEAMDLNDLLKSNKDQFEAGFNIHEQFKTTKYEVKLSLWTEVRDMLFNKYGSTFDIEISFTKEEKYPHILLGDKTCDEWYACICIDRLQGKTYYGICSFGYGERTAKQKKIIDAYKELCLPGFKTSEYWFSWKYFDNVDFYELETCLKTFSSTERSDLISQIFEPIDYLIKNYGDRILEINQEIHSKIVKPIK